MKLKSLADRDIWGTAPTELESREKIGENAPGDYVSHYIKYVLGAWKRKIADGDKLHGEGMTHTSMVMFNSAAIMKETEEALRPLMVDLKLKRMEDTLLSKIDSVVGAAADRKYATCIQEYVGITIGRKTWHQALSQVMQQQNHGGAISKIIKQSAFTEFDANPVINAYLVGLKRLIHVSQWLRPPTEPTQWCPS